MVLPFQNGVEIVGLIGALFRPQKAHPDDVADDDLQRLAVLFVHGKQHGREHHKHHHHGGRAYADTASQQEKQRNGEKSADSEADELPLGEVEQHLGFYFG